MKYLIKLTFILYGLVFLGTAIPALADCNGNVCPPTLLEGFNLFPIIVNAILAIAALVFFIILVVNGYSFITAVGDKEKIENAKKAIFYSVIGFALVFSPFIIIPAIQSITQVKTGVTIGSNGGIGISIGSTFTQTPLPSDTLPTATTTPAPSNPPTVAVSQYTYTPGLAGIEPNDIPNNDNKNGDGTNCNVSYLKDGVPIIFQGGQIDFSSHNNQACKDYGQYLNTTDQNTFAGGACSGASLAIDMDTWFNRLKILPILSVDTTIREEQSIGAWDGGYQWTGFVNPPEYRFKPMVTAANDIMKSKGSNVRFWIPTGAGIVGGDNHFPESNLNMCRPFTQVVTDGFIHLGSCQKAFDAVAQVVHNLGYPVIMGMDDHYLVVIDVDLSAGTVTTADPGGLTKGGSYGPGTLNSDGTQTTTSIPDFLNEWTGSAAILQTTETSATFPSY